jgi:hypothetical protein
MLGSSAVPDLTFALRSRGDTEANVKSTALALLKRLRIIGAPHRWASNTVYEQCKLG